MQSNSSKYSLNQIDWLKISKGLLIALGGALFTYAEQVFTQIDFGAYQAIAVAVNSVIVNVISKYLTDYQSKNNLIENA